jgi:hypothetical protein
MDEIMCIPSCSSSLFRQQSYEASVLYRSSRDLAGFHSLCKFVLWCKYLEICVSETYNSVLFREYLCIVRYRNFFKIKNHVTTHATFILEWFSFHLTKELCIMHMFMWTVFHLPFCSPMYDVKRAASIKSRSAWTSPMNHTDNVQ